MLTHPLRRAPVGDVPGPGLRSGVGHPHCCLYVLLSICEANWLEAVRAPERLGNFTADSSQDRLGGHDAHGVQY